MAVDHYQLRVQGLHQTEYNECVLHFRGTNLTAADYVANANDLIEAWNAVAVGSWCDLLPTSYELLRVTARKATPGGGADVSGQYQFGTQPGTIASAAASQQLCPAIILIPPMGIKTAGKIFMPCVAASSVSGNVLSAGYQTALSNLMTDLMAGISNSSIVWDLAIFSRKNNSFSEVADYSLSPIVGFQRRRQRAAL